MSGNKRTLPLCILLVGWYGLSLFSSCDDQVIAEFKITNKTLRRIDSLCVEPNRDLKAKYICLGPNETFNYKADLTGGAKTDGSYLLSYQIDKLYFQENFGYYTNGYPDGNRIDIEIDTDSVKIVEKAGVY